TLFELGEPFLVRGQGFLDAFGWEFFARKGHRMRGGRLGVTGDLMGECGRAGKPHCAGYQQKKITERHAAQQRSRRRGTPWQKGMGQVLRIPIVVHFPVAYNEKCIPANRSSDRGSAVAHQRTALASTTCAARRFAARSLVAEQQAKLAC